MEEYVFTKIRNAKEILGRMIKKSAGSRKAGNYVGLQTRYAARVFCCRCILKLISFPLFRALYQKKDNRNVPYRFTTGKKGLNLRAAQQKKTWMHFKTSRIPWKRNLSRSVTLPILLSCGSQKRDFQPGKRTGELRPIFYSCSRFLSPEGRNCTLLSPNRASRKERLE